MNKFVSFEMIFYNGYQCMGNMVVPYDDITNETDIKDVENIIKVRLNRGEEVNSMVDVVTLTNWKTL
jgi:hypothetical protein